MIFWTSKKSMKLLEQNPAITHDKPNKNVFQ